VEAYQNATTIFQDKASSTRLKDKINQEHIAEKIITTITPNID